MDIVSLANRPRRLRFFRLSSGTVSEENASNHHEPSSSSSSVIRKSFASTNNMWSGSRYVSESDATLMFDSNQSAKYTEYLEYKIGLGGINGNDHNHPEESL